MNKLFTLLFSIFIYFNINAQQVIILDDNKDIITVDKYIQFYKDDSKKLNIEQIKTDNFQQKFKPNTQNILNFGTTSSFVWIKLQFDIQTDKKYHLQIDNPFLDSVFVYFKNQQGIDTCLLTGKKLPIETESVRSTHTIIELPIQKGLQVQTIYLRVSSPQFLHIPIKLIVHQKTLNVLLERYILELIYFGVILLAIVYNLFVYISVRDVSYLYYVAYTFLMGLNIFINRGFLSYFFSEHRAIVSQYPYILSSVFPIFIILFTLNFLKVKQYSRLFYILLQVLMYCFIAILLFSFLGVASWVLRYLFILLLSNYTISLIVAIITYRRGYKVAIYYFLGWGIFMLLNTYALTAYFAWTEFYDFTKYITPTAIVIETILASFALANKINVLRKENIELIKNQKVNLEIEVERKTSEIEAQNEELRQQKEELIMTNEYLEEKNKELEIRDEKISEQNAELAQKQVKMISQNEKLFKQKQQIETLKDNLEKIVSQRTEELRQTLDNLTRQNQDLAQFSFIISHNLRAPVARILGLVNIFNEQNYNEDFNKQIISHLRQTTTDLDTVIRDLTQIISIRNDLNKTKEEIDIIEKIEQEKFLLKDEIEKSNATINTELVGIKKFLSIKSYFQSILHNLLSNAIKYKSNKRSLVVYIKTEQVSNYLCLSVSDNGLGLDLNKTDTYKVFGLYQRMHTHVEGKGLGLFLVKTQVESLGGKIEIESELDVGSTFKVYFPI